MPAAIFGLTDVLTPSHGPFRVPFERQELNSDKIDSHTKRVLKSTNKDCEYKIGYIICHVSNTTYRQYVIGWCGYIAANNTIEASVSLQNHNITLHWRSKHKQHA